MSLGIDDLLDFEFMDPPPQENILNYNSLSQPIVTVEVPMQSVPQPQQSRGQLVTKSRQRGAPRWH